MEVPRTPVSTLGPSLELGSSPKLGYIAQVAGASMETTTMNDEQKVDVDSIASRANRAPGTVNVMRLRGKFVADYFSMRERIALAKRAALRQGQPGFWEAHVASSLLESAEALEGAPIQALGAVSLLGQCITFAARSVTLQQGLADDLSDSAQIWRLVSLQLDVRSHLENLSATERRTLERFIAQGFTEAHPALAGDELSTLLRALAPVARALVKQAEASSSQLSSLRQLRILRWTLLILAILLLLAFASASVREKAIGRNLAQAGTVAVSSYRHAAQFPPAGLVDGDSSKLGCRVDDGPNSWAQLDLGARRTVHRVVITNHLDAVPASPVGLVVELSADGTNYTEFARQVETFSTWKASNSPTKARFVRIRLLTSGMLELNEVEVY